MGGFTELVLAWRSELVGGDADLLADHLMGVARSLATPFLRPESLA